MKIFSLRAAALIAGVAAALSVSESGEAAFLTVSSALSRVDVKAEYTTNNGSSWSTLYNPAPFISTANGVTAGTSSYNNISSAGGTATNKGFAMTSWDLSDPALTSGNTSGPVLVSGRGSAPGKGVRESTTAISSIAFTLNANATADLNLFSSLGTGLNASGMSSSRLFFNSSPTALYEAVGNSSLTLFGISLLAGNYELMSYTFLTGQSIGTNVSNSISGQASFDLSNITPVSDPLPEPSIAAVPEPASFAVWCIAAMGMILAHRRGRNQDIQPA